MIYVDQPVWPGRAGRSSAGRLWSHLVSDVSFAELHAFAELMGLPSHGFHGDHYDLPESLYEEAIWLGAVPVSSRELVSRLIRAGLRRYRHGHH